MNDEVLDLLQQFADQPQLENLHIIKIKEAQKNGNKGKKPSKTKILFKRNQEGQINYEKSIITKT